MGAFTSALSAALRPDRRRALIAGLLAVAIAAALTPKSWAEYGARAAAGLIAQVAGAMSTGRAGPVGLAQYAPSLPELPAVRTLPFRQGGPIDEAYRAAFNACDHNNRFEGRPLSKEGGCRRRPNRFEAFLRLPGDAVFMEAHLNLDLAGAALSCEPRIRGLDPDPRRCATFLDYEGAPTSAYATLGQRWRELFVSGDRTPFVTIPLPPETDAANPRAFLQKTGLGFGDVGVVFYRDRFTPVIIANAGPAHQALAGSLALFDRLGVPRCRLRAEEIGPPLEAAPNAPQAELPECAEPKAYGLGATVVAILFPGSAPAGLSPETILEQVEATAYARLEEVVARGVSLP